MKNSFLAVVFLILTAKNVFSVSRNFSGTLDASGKTEVRYTVSTDSTVFLQGWVLYRELWRPVPVFWSGNLIIIDLGPNYKDIPYKLSLRTD
ncbi:MAG: hypothetical protein KDK41_08965 [Leptospiraceae bacterium]|nr:hypothetical protein [Leptospiraceae bacterium]MCB1200763.1 hypothetical protein [Leptospiraceae bacterium]